MKRPQDKMNNQHEKLVQDILGRTSGSACHRALDLLPLLGTDGLNDGDRSLVQGHLEHCSGCRSVAVVLGWLGNELPTMAEVDPGLDFTAAVLARTAKLPSRAAAQGHLTGAAGLMDRLGRWWETNVLRPLFPLQVAYTLTVLFMVLTAIPGAPLRQVPNRILETVQAGPMSIPLVGNLVESLDPHVVIGGKVLAPLHDRVNSRWGRLEGGFQERLADTRVDRGDLRLNLRAMGKSVHAGSLGQAGLHLMESGRNIKDIWCHWWRLEIQSTAQTSERSPS